VHNGATARSAHVMALREFIACRCIMDWNHFALRAPKSKALPARPRCESVGRHLQTIGQRENDE
jgi:hypothetical protein